MFRTRTARLTAAALCMVAVGAPLMGAGPDGRGERHGWGSSRVFGRVQVNIGYPHKPEIRRCEEALPCDLRLTAYQSRDTVIIVATGTNKGRGFATEFIACDICDDRPELRLRNTSSGDTCEMGPSAFEVSASFHTRHRLGCIKVIVAGQAFDVHVIQTPCL